MSKKEKNNNGKKQKKVKKLFHLVIYDEKTLDEILNFKLSKVNLFTYFGALVIVITVLVVLLFVFTPLNMLLPRYQDVKLRSQAIENRILIDSLKHEIAIRDTFFKKIRIIVEGQDLSKLEHVDTVLSKHFISQQEHDSLLKQLSKSENQYYQFISQDMSKQKISSLRFYKPVSGIIINKFDPSQGHYGVDLTAKKDEPVLSVLAGTVIYSGWNPNTGYVIMVQHSHDLISVYKHCSQLLKHEGDHVDAGEPIAIAGNTGENTTGPHLHFELWYKGVPVNPESYIIF